MARVLEEPTSAEIDNLAREVNGRLTAIGSELSDVETQMENLYQALKTKQLLTDVLSPSILSLKSRQSQLVAAQVEVQAQLGQRRAELPTSREIKGYVADFREFLMEETFPEQKALIRNVVRVVGPPVWDSPASTPDDRIVPPLSSSLLASAAMP